MAEISVDAVNMLGKITAEFRDAEARLRGLALKEAAQTEGMATTRAEWEAEAKAFGDKKAAFEAELAQLKAEHQQQVRSAMDTARGSLERSEIQAKKLVDDATSQAKSLKKAADDAAASVGAQHKAVKSALDALNIELTEKKGLLADIKERIQAILDKANV